MSLGDTLKMMEIVGSTGFSRKGSAAEAFRLKPVLPTISRGGRNASRPALRRADNA
jgi:hypothetical protein